MPRDEPTEDIVRREIAKARDIIRNDKLLASHRQLSDRFSHHFPDKSPGTDPGNPDGPQPPDPKPPADPAPPKKSLWWGPE